MVTKYYDIHGIYKFTISNNTNCNFFNYLNTDFSFFQVDFVDDPDMSFNIGTFSPENEDCYIVDNKYHLKNNYFYCRDSAGGQKWEAEILGFESGKMNVNFNFSSKPKLVNLCLPIYIFLLEGMLMYALSNLGYYIIHAAAVSKNDKAILFAGRGGSFKTSLVMDFVRKLKFKYMSDDKIILNKNSAFAFPLNISRFNFMLNNMEDESYKNKLEKMKLAYHLLINKNDIHKDYNCVTNKSAVGQLIFVSKNNSTNIEVRKISDSKEIIGKLIENNRLELCLHGSHMPSLTKIKTNPFYRYMLEYSYLYPESKVAKYWENLEGGLTDIINMNEIYEVQMPFIYDEKSFEEVLKHMIL